MAERFADTPTPDSPSMAWATLAASVDASTTTFTLSTAWPAHSRYRIESETGRVTAGFGTTTITVVRGAGAAVHVLGAGLFGVLTAAGLVNSPGAMTTEGDLNTLDSSGNVARIPSTTYVKPSELITALAAYSATLATTYQPLDPDLTAIAALATNGFAKRTGVGMWVIDTATYLTAVTAHDLLSATHGDTTAGAVARGDVMTGQGASAKWARLAKGSANQVLAMDGSGVDVAWVTPSSGVAWGAITGTLSGQTDLQAALDLKAPLVSPGFTTPALGAFTGSTGALTGALTSTQAIGATSTDGLVLQNTTAATVGAQKWSPRLRLTGQGWKTTATAASQAVDWIAEVQPVQGTTSPTSKLALSSQVNAAGYTPQMYFTSDKFLMAGDGNSGIKMDGFFVNFYSNGTSMAQLGGSFAIAGTLTVGDANGSGVGSGGSAIIRADANHVLAQRNGTNAQRKRVYNTFTTVETAGEWFDIDWITTANTCILSTRKGSSTGTLRGMLLGASSAVPIGHYGVTPVTQQTVTGSRGGNAALADLLTKLAATGLIVDGSSA